MFKNKSLYTLQTVEEFWPIWKFFFPSLTSSHLLETPGHRLYSTKQPETIGYVPVRELFWYRHYQVKEFIAGMMNDSIKVPG